MPTIVWFNVPAAETGRARAFYEEVFSWTAEPFPGMEGAFELAAGGIGGEILPQAHPGDPITVFVGIRSGLIMARSSSSPDPIGSIPRISLARDTHSSQQSRSGNWGWFRRSMVGHGGYMAGRMVVSCGKG